MNKIAIIRISTLFPDAETPEQYWQNLLAQKDSRSTATAVAESRAEYHVK
jgi:acyl transferase domain-containing protein